MTPQSQQSCSPEEEQGVSRAMPSASLQARAGDPSDRSQQAVSGKAAIPIAGPYWVRTNTNGSHDVCGRHAKIVRRYRADQLAAATEDCRRLQKGFTAEQKRIRDAAPELLEALEEALMELNWVEADAEAKRPFDDIEACADSFGDVEDRDLMAERQRVRGVIRRIGAVMNKARGQ